MRRPSSGGAIKGMATMRPRNANSAVLYSPVECGSIARMIDDDDGSCTIYFCVNPGLSCIFNRPLDRHLWFTIKESPNE
jgi:hypothetical protein